MISARKRLESIESNVLPSMFAGRIIKDEIWLKKTLEKTLPNLEKKAIELALECKAEGECSENELLCDETRIRELFIFYYNKVHFSAGSALQNLSFPVFFLR